MGVEEIGSGAARQGEWVEEMTLCRGASGRMGRRDDIAARTGRRARGRQSHVMGTYDIYDTYDTYDTCACASPTWWARDDVARQEWVVVSRHRPDPLARVAVVATCAAAASSTWWTRRAICL